MGSDGALVASGVRWTETRPIVVKLLAVPMFAAIMTMFLTGLVMLAKGFPREPSLYFVCGLVTLIGSIWLVLQCGGRKRSLVFHRDGRIETPEGLPTDGRFRAFGFSHERISSFEKRFARKLDHNNQQFFVELLSHDGDWVTIGDTMTEQQSHMVTVQLTKALREIREAASRADQSFGAADAMRMAGEAINRMKRRGEGHFVID